MGILFWPGIHRKQDELLYLRNILSELNNNQVNIMQSKYDLGSMPSSKESVFINEIEREPTYKWWIGLSLGAAVAYVSACTVSLDKRPSRLTLINTFHDRLKLSKRMKFSMDKQWPLIPQNSALDSNIHVDLVISDEDKKMPPEFGLKMLESLSTNNVKLIKIKADHQISSPEYQVKLATVLLADSSTQYHYNKYREIHIT